MGCKSVSEKACRCCEENRTANGSIKMLTVRKNEEAALELQGARARLAKVLHELELFHGHRDGDEYAWLLVEYDEASKNLMRCREKVTN